MIRYLSDAPLGRCCTFLTGGRAKRLAFAYNADELAEAADSGALVLGRGSNVLIGDCGYAGDAVINRTNERVFEGGVCVCDSGVLISSLAREYMERGLSGLEWAYGLPGTVGGATVGNAGAFGGCMADVLDSVTVLSGGKVRELKAEECGFKYRASGIRGTVLKLRLKAPLGDAETIRELSERNLARRRKTQPLGASAGSVFKAAGLLPAGLLIDRAGLKGAGAGGAEISPIHANFIINRGGATSGDVLRLILEAEMAVFLKYGIRLEREIKLLGEFF